MSSRLSPFFARLAVESGFITALHSSRDTKLLCLQRFVRLFAYGASFLVLVQFLSSLGITDGRIGVFMTLTLVGDTLISFLLTLITDQIGRRRVLATGAGLMLLSGLTFSLATNYWLLVIASVVGVISPSGNEIGPFKAVEESILSQLTEKDKRSDIFAWYMLFGTAGAALGTFTSGWLVQALQDRDQSQSSFPYRAVFILYAIIGAVKLVLTLLLSPAVEIKHSNPQYHEVGVELDDDSLLSSESGDEAETQTPVEENHALRSSTAKPSEPSPSKLYSFDRLWSLVPRISPLSRRILLRLIILFTLDSFASGMASPSWLTYFFTAVHLLKPSSLGTLFLITNMLATISNLLALPMARRLGPLKTMAFTHLPSAMFLAVIPFFPTSSAGTWAAMVALSLRACTSSMDQAPRQAFIAAAVLPAERTAVLGIVNMWKTLAQAGGIGSSGTLAAAQLWIVMLGGAGMMKAAYDLLMLWMFLGLKDRDEGDQTAA